MKNEMREEMIKEQICDIGRRMYQRNMVAANDGNISVRISEHEILCTPTGVSKGFMTPEYICKTDERGNLLEANGNFRPSSEMKMHLKIYEKRPDIMAVVHAHPMFATSFAIVGIPLTQPIMPEAVVNLGTVPIAPYATPSTEEVPQSIVPFLDDYNAILLSNHGALAWGKDLTAAYYKLESLEFYAELLYRTRQLGGARELNEEQVEKLYEIKKKLGL